MSDFIPQVSLVVLNTFFGAVAGFFLGVRRGRPDRWLNWPLWLVVGCPALLVLAYYQRAVENGYSLTAVLSLFAAAGAGLGVWAVVGRFKATEMPPKEKEGESCPYPSIDKYV